MLSHLEYSSSTKNKNNNLILIVLFSSGSDIYHSNGHQDPLSARYGMDMAPVEASGINRMASMSNNVGLTAGENRQEYVSPYARVSITSETAVGVEGREYISPPARATTVAGGSSRAQIGSTGNSTPRDILSSLSQQKNTGKGGLQGGRVTRYVIYMILFVGILIKIIYIRKMSNLPTSSSESKSAKGKKRSRANFVDANENQYDQGSRERSNTAYPPCPTLNTELRISRGSGQNNAKKTGDEKTNTTSSLATTSSSSNLLPSGPAAAPLSSNFGSRSDDTSTYICTMFNGLCNQSFATAAALK